MPNCKKCNKEFPNWIVLDGQRKNLCNRKFCLECSPRGFHNTKDLSKPESCCYINKPGTKEYTKEKYEKYKHKTNPKSVIRIRNTRKERKIKLVELMGGKCSVCGYDKYLGALEFHHLIPSQKSFEMNTTKLSRYSWDTILNEAKKCILLCANCHRETHQRKDT